MRYCDQSLVYYASPPQIALDILEKKQLSTYFVVAFLGMNLNAAGDKFGAVTEKTPGCNR